MRPRWAAAMLLLTSVLLLHLCSPALGAERHTQPDRHMAERPMCAPSMAESPKATTHPLVGQHVAAHPTSPVHPASGHRTVPAAPLPAVAPALTPDAPDPQRAGKPSPGIPDSALHLRLARSPRTAGAAGAAPHTATDAQANAVPPERAARGAHPSGTPQGAEPALPAHDASALQTFRC
ncbi:hypothetical protein [Streptomyces hirsutus]|uniref:hypothetical protein n=1 Tax=Streptomyces hirsutus TaxID=35620 RepID=UPI00365FC852